MSDSIPMHIAQKLDTIKHKGGVLTCVDDQYTYVLLATGERPTGGYAIRVLQAEQVLYFGQPVIELTVLEQRPGPGDIVTQALTYPATVYKMPRTDLPVQVRWQYS